MPPPQHIAILGGGLTGLSSAFHLSRRFPTTTITLLEKQARLGGWVRSTRVALPSSSNASVVLEAGPRSLRPNAKSVLELINLLNLQSSVITVPKTSAAAKARFLYVPESSAETPAMEGLQCIPSSLMSLLTSPLRSVLLPAVLREPLRRGNRPKGINDESVDAFFTRRFGESFARTFGSALVHGIYAADSRELSVRAAFPTMWEAEERGGGSVVRGLLFSSIGNDEERTYELGNTLDIMRGVSVYSFRNGMDTLTMALEQSLRSRPNIHVLSGTGVTAIRKNQEGSFEISTPSELITATHVVSTLPLPHLQTLTETEANLPTIPHLSANPSSTVHVFNLVFPVSPSTIHPEGFGFLIPRPKNGYLSSEPGILGTVFDSCSLFQQDTPRPQNSNYYTDSAFTKLTVMSGGPYLPLPLPPAAQERTHDIPDAIRAVVRILETQLGKKIPDPVLWRAWRNEACIPTMRPGHLQRIDEMKRVLAGVGWEGRLEVIGAGVGGVSVGDCVEAGRQVGKLWV